MKRKTSFSRTNAVQDLRRRVRELEAKLAETRQRPTSDDASFRSSVIARAAEGLCVCHAVEEFPFVRFTIWNDRMTEITGYTMDEINRLGWYQTVYPDPETSARAMQRMARMRDGDDLLGEEWTITRVDGETRVVSISTTLLQTADGSAHVLALMQDATARHRAERALRESEAHYRTIVQHAPVGIFEADAEGHLLAVNPRCAQVLGCRPEDLLGKRDRDLVHPDDAGLFDTRADQLKRGETDAIVFELRLVRKDESPVWVSITLALLGADDTTPIRRIGVVQDVTALKEAEQERQQLQSEMQHAQKLESLGVLAGGIAHDFNNLLCGILGRAELALHKLEPGHPARSPLQLLNDAAQRAAELCHQMLAYSGKAGFVVEAMDSTRLVENTRPLLEVAVSKKATIRFHLASDLPPVDADATQIRQVLLNLVVNASEALAEESGAITVSTGAMNCDRAYLQSVYLPDRPPEGRYVFLEVADTGRGMDAETKKRIFDPFFTTKFAGRGLGLAATLGIVRGHRGAIKVYSEPGVGTTIKVLLPASSKTLESFDRPAEDDSWTGRGIVLLVDDEPAVRSVGQEMLAVLGFDVLLAEDGEQAIQTMRQRGTEISLVILDLTMPKLGGQETFRELQSIRPTVPVVLTSGYNEQDTVNRFIGKGLAGFIQKPFLLKTLRARLRAILEGRAA